MAPNVGKNDRDKVREIMIDIKDPKVQIAIAIIGAVGAVFSAMVPIIFSSNQTTVSVSEFKSPTTTTVTAPEIRRATIILKKVVVADKKQNGKKWDADGSLPDIQAVFQNITSGQKSTTQTAKNCLEKIFNVETIRVVPGDMIKITVNDVDLAMNDLIGEITVQITSEMMVKSSCEGKKNMSLLENLAQIAKDTMTSPIIRERLLLANEQAIALEKKVKELQEENAQIKEENRKLKDKIARNSVSEEFVEYNGALFKRDKAGCYHKAVYCPRCKTSVSAMEVFMPFACNCGWMANFHGNDLEKIMRELEKLKP